MDDKEKKKRRKKGKNYWAGWGVQLNAEGAKRIRLASEEIAALISEYPKINPKNPTGNERFLPELALLRGPQGQKAWVRKNPSYYQHKLILSVELPLELRAKDVRASFERAVNFFQPLLIADSETISKEGSFSRLKQKPYRELEVSEGKDFKEANKAPKSILRVKTFADIKAGYGSNSSQNQIFYRRRNTWIQQRYKELRVARYSEYDAYHQIKVKLEVLKDANLFGYYRFVKRAPFDLGIVAIRSIVQRKPS